MPTRDEPYAGREQTQVKHFILKSYLQALVYKLLTRYRNFSFVDGFSGPWESRQEDFSDTSFKIAIEVLREAQNYFREKGETRTIRCFLVEKKKAAYQDLTREVVPYRSPDENFLIRARHGRFEDAVPEIVEFVDDSFALVFIDPTGWTGYPYHKISPLLRHRPGEVLINFMYDFVNRFIESSDPATEASLNPILGGPGWKDRLEGSLPRGVAVEELYRQELKKAGQYSYVLSTCIEKTNVDRPHYFLAYGTRNYSGLRAFRDIEFNALQKYEETRDSIKQKKAESSRRRLRLNQVRWLYLNQDKPLKEFHCQSLLRETCGRQSKTP